MQLLIDAMHRHVGLAEDPGPGINLVTQLLEFRPLLVEHHWFIVPVLRTSQLRRRAR